MKRCLSLLAIGLATVAWAAAGVAAEQLVPREHHPWGRFKTGSWKQVRVVTETLDAQGKVTGVSKTDTKSTLIEMDESGYTLEIEVTSEVAGKRFRAQPQDVTQGFNGETAGQRLVSITRLGPGTINVSGREIASDRRQLIVNGGDQKRTTTIHYCSDVEPYILKRETSTTDAAGQATLSQNLVEVVAVDMPLQVLDKLKTVSHVKTIGTRPGGKTITLETHCLDVPGTVVAHTSKELDETGRAIRRSTLELVAYAAGDGQDDAKNRRGLFNRRTRKSSPAR